jgi:acetoin utilization protein AcuB
MPRWVATSPVRDWMSRQPVVVNADAPATIAGDLLRERHIRHLPVVDRTGRLVGIITDRDLRQVGFHPLIGETPHTAGAPLAALTVRDLMTWGVVSVRHDTDLRAAARLMRERKIGALPVVEDDTVIGILTETDVLRAADALLGRRVTTVRPLRATAATGKPYEYGFPAPQADGDPREEGTAQ